MVEMENIQWQQQRQLMESNSSPTVLRDGKFSHESQSHQRSHN